MSKEEFQALVNSRVQRSVSERAAALAAYNASAEKAQVDAAAAKAAQLAATLTRFSAVYRTPSGQAIRFDPPPPKAPAWASTAASSVREDDGSEPAVEFQRLRNTPPTPRFGAGKSLQHATEVEWSFYEAVHPHAAEARDAAPGNHARGSTRPGGVRQEARQPLLRRPAPPAHLGFAAVAAQAAAKSLSPPSAHARTNNGLGARGGQAWGSAPSPSGFGHHRLGRGGGGLATGSSSSSPPSWPVAPLHAAHARRPVWDAGWGAELPLPPAKTAYANAAVAVAEKPFSASSLAQQFVGEGRAHGIDKQGGYGSTSSALGGCGGGGHGSDHGGFGGASRAAALGAPCGWGAGSGAAGVSPLGGDGYARSSSSGGGGVGSRSGGSAAVPLPLAASPRAPSPEVRRVAAVLTSPSNSSSGKDGEGSSNDDELDIQFGFGF
jgi:hypothetical protein